MKYSSYKQKIIIEPKAIIKMGDAKNRLTISKNFERCRSKKLLVIYRSAL